MAKIEKTDSNNQSSMILTGLKNKKTTEEIKKLEEQLKNGNLSELQRSQIELSIKDLKDSIEELKKTNSLAGRSIFDFGKG